MGDQFYLTTHFNHKDLYFSEVNCLESLLFSLPAPMHNLHNFS